MQLQQCKLQMRNYFRFLICFMNNNIFVEDLLPKSAAGTVG